MTDNKANQCVVCGDDAGESALFKSRSFVARQLADGTTETEPLPRVPVCRDHIQEIVSGPVVVGWCDDSTCRRWGILGDTSPCGEPYLELPSAL